MSDQPVPNSPLWLKVVQEMALQSQAKAVAFTQAEQEMAFHKSLTLGDRQFLQRLHIGI